jgi:hypothetical protein
LRQCGLFIRARLSDGDDLQLWFTVDRQQWWLRRATSTDGDRAVRKYSR